MEAQKQFGTQLRGLLRRVGLSQEELAYRVHMSPSLVSHWLAGRRVPRQEMILRIAEILVTVGRHELHPIELMGWISWLGYEFPSGWLRKRYPHLSDTFWIGVATGGFRWQAERLPDHYVERPAELEKLVEWLLTPPAEPERRAGRRVAITGMPGVGKTTLARAAVWHPQVRSCFPDGVLWANLGRLGEPTAWLGRWARALGLPLLLDGDPLWLRDAVATRLNRRRCLLVVDGADRWESLELLLFDAPSCVTLLTTQSRGVADAAEAGLALVQVGVMSEGESLALLERCAGRELVEKAGEIAVEVGYHPLALRVAGGLAREWGNWRAVLERLREARLAVLSYEGNLAAVLGAAYQGLPAGDQRVFRTLGAMAAGVGFSVGAVVTLLGGETNPIETELALTRLAQRGLAQRVEGATGQYRQHLLCADYAAEQLSVAGEAELVGARHANYYLRLLDDAGEMDGDDAFQERLDLAWENVLAARAWRQMRGEPLGEEDNLRRELVAGRYAVLRDEFDRFDSRDIPLPESEAKHGTGKGAAVAAYRALAHAHAGRVLDAAKWLDQLEELAERAPHPEWPFIMRAVQLYAHLTERDWKRMADALEAVHAASLGSETVLIREAAVAAAQAVQRRYRRFAEEAERSGQLERLAALVEMVEAGSLLAVADGEG